MKKITIFIMMLVMCATTTFAQTAITSLEDVKAGKIYWFQNRYLSTLGYASSLYYPGVEGWNDYLWSSAGWLEFDDPNDPKEHFAFVEYEGKFYLYSVGADNFVTYKDDGAHISTIPSSFVTVQVSTIGDASFPWCIAFDGNKLIGQYYVSGYEYSGYLYCTGSDTANTIYAWQIYEVGDLANADELTARLAAAMDEGVKQREAAMTALRDLSAEVDNFFIDIEYSYVDGSQVTLQTTDSEADNYIWCNEPELSEGPIKDLIDNDVNTFFHSCWNEFTEPQHWLQIDLGKPIQDFSFAYHTRTGDIGNDFPDAIEVMGSNDGENFTSIVKFDSMLPQTVNTRWESELIEADQEYKHLRFVVTAERLYFHMSEFYLYAASNVTVKDEAYLQYKEQLMELWEMLEASDAMYDEALDTEDIEAFIAEMSALYDLVKNLISGADDPLTIEYIEVAKGMLSAEGVGYPGEAPRAALQASVDAAEAKPTTLARLDLEEAIEEYIASDDIILPVDGQKYTLTFVTYDGRRNYLSYETTEDGSYTLSMVRDTITAAGLSLPETAAFTCVDNADGTFDFMTADGKYFTTPDDSTVSGSATGISVTPTCFIIEKMHPNDYCEVDVTHNELFGLVTLNNNNIYMAPTSSGKTFYVGVLPYFLDNWTSVMAIEAWVPGDGEDTGVENVGVDGAVEGIYDLLGRKVENPSAGIYIINGKKVLVK